MNNNNTTTTSFEDTWAKAFTQYLYLGSLTKTILRNSAAMRLKEKGFDEIGSSDINHELFHMWQIANYDWEKAVIIEVDNFAANLR